MQTFNKKIPVDLFDVIIVGGGVAGLAAAMTTGRSGLEVLLLEKTVLGGSGRSIRISGD